MSDTAETRPADPQGLPPGRYGSPRPLPRWAAVALIALGVLALVPVAIAALHRAAPAVRATLVGYTVIDANRVEASVDMRKGGAARLTCEVRARNLYSETVGSAQFVLAGPASSGVVRKSFPTSDEAVVVEVVECKTSDGG